MALDRQAERPGEGVSQMIARKQYNRAIEVLRVRLQQKRPDSKTRLRLADLLVQAGRGTEAVPVLLTLADEFANEGFVAKAVAVLKRVEKIKPRLAEVNQRLDRLALRRERALAVPTSRLEPGPEDEAAGDPLLATPVPAARLEPVARPDGDAETAAPSENVVKRMRGLLGRLLGGRPDAPAARASPEATQPGPAPTSAPSAPEVQGVAAPVPVPAAPPVESGAELDASAFLPRSFTPIPPAPAALAASEAAPAPAAEVEPGPAAPAPAESPTPSTEAALAESAPVEVQPAEREPAADQAAAEPTVEPTPEPRAAEPEAPPAAVAAEPQAASTEREASDAATPAVAAAADEEPRPEGGFRSFLGRLWGRRRDEPVGAPLAEAMRAPEATDATAEPATAVAPSAEAAAPQQASAVAEPATAAPAQPASAPDEATAPAVEPAPTPAETSAPPAEELPIVAADAPAQAAAGAPAPIEQALTEADFHERLLDVVQEALVRPAPQAAPAAPAGSGVDTTRLQRSPLLVELDEAELRQLVRDLQLRTCEPGDIVLTEGEPGETLFLLVGGTVKVFVRNPKSRNIEVRELVEGDFFGEVGFLSGRPRTATVVAATSVELLELERPALERLAEAHPGMLDMLEAYYLVRTQSEAVATLRSAAIDDPDVAKRAAEVLKAHFGEAQWDPRTRLKLAEALLKSGKQQEALPILAGLADELVRAGYTEKAVAILKRIERIEGRHTEEISLAPLKRAATPAPPAPTALPAAQRPENEGGFNGWLLELVRESVERGERRPSAGAAPGLLMSPLFEDFSEEELLALVRGLRLHEGGPGDVIITEGEEGNSVFVLTAGVLKVFVKNPLGHNVLVGKLGEGDFFGEISLLSGRPRSATLTAAGPCELLELDKPTLERVCAEHPRVRSVMEDVYIERASHALAARVRGDAPAPEA